MTSLETNIEEKIQREMVLVRKLVRMVCISHTEILQRVTEEQKRRMEEEDWTVQQIYAAVMHPDEKIIRGRFFRRIYEEVEGTLHEAYVIKQQDIDEERGECVICLEELKVEETVQKCSGCKPYFHEHCLSKWLKQTPCCPYCKRPAQ